MAEATLSNGVASLLNIAVNSNNCYISVDFTLQPPSLIITQIKSSCAFFYFKRGLFQRYRWFWTSFRENQRDRAPETLVCHWNRISKNPFSTHTSTCKTANASSLRPGILCWRLQENRAENVWALLWRHQVLRWIWSTSNIGVTLWFWQSFTLSCCNWC